MEKKKKSSFARIIRFMSVLPAFFRLANHCYLIIKEDTVLAKKNVVALFFLCFIVILLVISTWFSLLGLLLSYFIVSLQLSWPASLAILLILNLFLLLMITIIMLLLKKKLFARTRELVRYIR